MHVVKLPCGRCEPIKIAHTKTEHYHKKKKLVHTVGKTEEPGVLQPMGSQTVVHSLVTKQ